MLLKASSAPAKDTFLIAASIQLPWQGTADERENSHNSRRETMRDYLMQINGMAQVPTCQPTHLRVALDALPLRHCGSVWRVASKSSAVSGSTTSNVTAQETENKFKPVGNASGGQASLGGQASVAVVVGGDFNDHFHPVEEVGSHRSCRSCSVGL